MEEKSKKPYSLKHIVIAFLIGAVVVAGIVLIPQFGMQGRIFNLDKTYETPTFQPKYQLKKNDEVQLVDPQQEMQQVQPAQTSLQSSFNLQTSSTENSITINFNSISNAVGYNVYLYIPNSDGTFPSVASQGYGITNTNYTFNNLNPGITYRVKVKAKDSNGNFILDSGNEEIRTQGTAVVTCLEDDVVLEMTSEGGTCYGKTYKGKITCSNNIEYNCDYDHLDDNTPDGQFKCTYRELSDTYKSQACGEAVYNFYYEWQ